MTNDHNVETQRDLKQSVLLTRKIRQNLNEVARTSARRRVAWYDLNRSGVTYKELAAANGVSEQSVYKELKKVREGGTLEQPVYEESSENGV